MSLRAHLWLPTLALLVFGGACLPQVLWAAAIVYAPQREAVLFEEQADQPRAPASLVKCMTALLVCEAAANGTIALNATATAPPAVAATTGARLGLAPGDRLPVADLLAAMLVGSANDAAVTLAAHVAGSVEAFVAAMNARAAALGLTRTRFATPNGLPAPNQYSTARDLARLAGVLIQRHPWILHLSSRRTVHLRLSDQEEVVLHNRNDLLGLPGVDGLKTGATTEAGACILVTALRQGRRLIVVVLGAPDAPARAREAATLLERGFASAP